MDSTANQDFPDASQISQPPACFLCKDSIDPHGLKRPVGFLNNCAPFHQAGVVDPVMAAGRSQRFM